MYASGPSIRWTTRVVSSRISTDDFTRRWAVPVFSKRTATSRTKVESFRPCCVWTSQYSSTSAPTMVPAARAFAAWT
jgi:hypothetical protein